MIGARNLRLCAGTRTLLEDVSFELQAGEFAAVLGPNGVGKTTLLRTIAGLREPDSGDVLVDGVSVRKMQAAQRARAIAHIAADEVFVEQLTVRDVVSMGRYAHHRWWQWREEPQDTAAIASALDAVTMSAFASRPFATLSSGERQRIWLAMALAQEAQLLLLDEPTSHLDVRVAQDILNLLHAQVRAGKTVVCVLHDLNEAAQFADQIMILGCSELLALGSPDRVLTTTILERAYGIPMELTRTPSGRLRVFPAGGSSTN
jgi:iron complex transport system ATP-binding protein